MPLFVQILVAVLCVFGAYMILWSLACRLFSSGRAGACVSVETRADADDLEVLLREAEDSVFFFCPARITVLFLHGCVGDEPDAGIRNVLEKYGARYFVIPDGERAEK